MSYDLEADDDETYAWQSEHVHDLSGTASSCKGGGDETCGEQDADTEALRNP